MVEPVLDLGTLHERQNIFLGNSSAASGAGDTTQIHAMLLCEPPYQRRGANTLGLFRAESLGRCRFLWFGSGGFGWLRPHARCGCGRLGSRRSAFAGDHRDHVVDLDGLSRSNLDFTQHTTGRRGNFGIDLVGRNLKQRLIARNFVAHVFQPARDGAFKDGFSHLGHDNVGGRAGRQRWRGRRGRNGLCGRCGRCGSRSACRWRLRNAGGCTGVVNHGDHGVHLHGRARLRLDLLENATGRSGYFGIDFIGGNLKQRLIALYSLTGLFEPLGDRAFENRFSHLGHDDIGWHRFPSAGASVPQSTLLQPGTMEIPPDDPGA